MKVTCTQENLARGLRLVSNLSSKNINLPILNNVLLQADKEGLTLITTNLEVGIRTKVRGKVEQPGTFTVQAKLLADFVNSLKQENIDIELQENTLFLKGENHKTKIKGDPATDFPLIPELTPTTKIEIAYDDFKKALNQVVFAASNDEARPELNAILFKFENQQLVLVATDSYRLAETKINLSEGKGEEQEIIVPLRTVLYVTRMLPEVSESKVIFEMNDNQIKFRFGDTEVFSRIIEGQYPDYKQIIPTIFTSEVFFNVSEMLQNIKTTALFCQPGINDIKLTYQDGTKEMHLQAQNSTAGDNDSKLEVETTGKDGEIVFNYRYVIDGLNNMGQKKAILKLNDSNNPGLLQSKEDKDFLYLIMPIKQ